ncbi:cation transporter [Arsenicitalea aurantiaca]|uniref:Cation transporter n=1 Tax=Arsenicitalea aurantiaca TaxID=1783274 RepID=A0A433X2Q5_9HYPH|nr:monovalent cation/H+ antiporter complex subunit F [Arsenicitalea aurantiaca]RUT28351.1 cation transporter [Arsenicitalea aurantiaca]
MIGFLDDIVTTVAIGLVAFLMIPLGMTVLRMIVGPGYADRFVALDMLTGLAVALGALTAVVTGRREFLDVAFGLAVFGFVATCALAAFLERKGAGK